MFELTVELEFDAAHFLRGYKGKCERLHGHRYRVATTISTAKLGKDGLAYDFREMKLQLGKVIEAWDHHCLNEVPPFDKVNPSAENIAFTVYGLLSPVLPRKISLREVTVWESPGSRATFRP